MHINKIKCNCGKIATWLYTPGEKFPFYCDDCVPRGCSCNWRNRQRDGLIEGELPQGFEGKNWKWVTIEEQKNHGVNNPEEKIFWVELDEDGKTYPCCEYDYDEKGYDIKDFEDE